MEYYGRNLIKIDYDGKDIDRYIKKAYPILEILAYRFKFELVDVLRTTHGYHIYLNCYLREDIARKEKIVDKELDLADRLLLETLLYGDVRKQAICYVEKEDILFNSKRGKTAFRDEKAKKKLQRVLDRINRNKYNYVHISLNK